MRWLWSKKVQPQVSNWGKSIRRPTLQKTMKNRFAQIQTPNRPNNQTNKRKLNNKNKQTKRSMRQRITNIFTRKKEKVAPIPPNTQNEKNVFNNPTQYATNSTLSSQVSTTATNPPISLNSTIPKTQENYNNGYRNAQQSNPFFKPF
jgi:hypothetical protein